MRAPTSRKADVLTCSFCPEDFPDFAALAEHVKKDHPDWFKQDGPLLIRPKKAAEAISAEMDGKKVARNERSNDKAQQSNNRGGGGQRERLPLLDAELFDKLAGKDNTVEAEITNVIRVDTRKWQGIILNLRIGKEECSFLIGYDRWDLKSLISQFEGSKIKFTSREGSKGTVFVNIWNPYSKDEQR
jgi:hypothetical protein